MDKYTIYVELLCVILVVSLHYSSGILDTYEEDDDDSSWNRCPWIRNRLPNGRVKIRSRGRIAKFQCDPGFELAGKRFATCVRGQWNNPIPVCVARGCSRKRYVPNTRVTEMFRGAVLTYDCLPGYTLDGGATIYCDGRRWSSSAPTCEPATSDPLTSCDFETSDLCGWSHDPTHDFDWRRNQFMTPSGHVGTGPSYDHTFGEGNGGFYMYLEASAPRKPNDAARLFSPVYPKDYSGGCFTFWYHMYGYNTGGLKIYIKPESHVFGELLPSWTVHRDQGDHWILGNVTVPHINENFQIIIEGLRGNGYVGDSAIDDVSLNNANCDNIGNATEHDTKFNLYSCRGRCRSESHSDGCTCNDDCVDEDNCCSDYLSVCARNTEPEETDSPDEQKATQTPSIMTTSKVISKETEQPTIVDVSVSTSPALRTTLPSTKSVEVSSPSTSSNTEIYTTNAVKISTFVTTFPTSAIALSTTTSTVIPPTTTSSSTSSTTAAPTTSTTLITTTTPVTTKVPTTTPYTTTSINMPSTTGKVTTQVIFYPTTYGTKVATKATTSSLESKRTSPITKVISSTSPISTTKLISTTTEAVTSTRKIYNLRPRNRTTSISPAITTPTPSYTKITTSKSPSTTLSTHTVSSSSAKSEMTSAVSTKWFSLTTKRPNFFTAMHTTMYAGLPETVKTTVTTSRTKFVFTTEKNIFQKDAHASKTASKSSNSSQPTVPIVFTIIIVLLIFGAVSVYVLRKWKLRKQSKLADDSEMRCLSENEVIEFSDSSVLDRQNFNQPLIGIFR